MLPQFPDFSELALDDKGSYNRLVEQHPPLSDISFATLHIWWNLDGKLAISSLNQNLVINYDLPGDTANSGYGLVGNSQIDDSLQTILKFLSSQGLPPRVVHVPEFTIKQIRNPERFQLEDEVDYQEYVVDSRALSELEGRDLSRIRRKVNRFKREVEGKRLEIKELDLASPKTKEAVMESIQHWEMKHPKQNDPGRSEHKAISKSLDHGPVLGMNLLGLYVDEELHAVVLYHQPVDKNYIIVNHLKVDYSTPFIFDYVTHHLAARAAEQGIPYMNMEMDLGIEGLRNHKMGLRPIHFFKKYTITSRT